MFRISLPISSFNPRQASHGTEREQLFAILFVGGWTGITVAMSMYVFHMNKLAPSWAESETMALVAFVVGILIKLLVGDVRTSFKSLLFSIVVGVVATSIFVLSPYYLLDIGTTTLLVVFGPIKNILMLFGIFQLPVQVAGYLTGFLIDGLRS